MPFLCKVSGVAILEPVAWATSLTVLDKVFLLLQRELP